MKTIADLITETVDAKQASEESLLEVDPLLRPGREALRNQAKQTYQDLYSTVRNSIMGYAGGIIVSGPGAAKFAAIAEDEGPSLTLDASEMYTKVVEEWYPTVRVDRVFSLDSLPAFLNGVTRLLPLIGVRTIHAPDFKETFGRKVLDVADALALTRDILRQTVGDDLNALYLRDRLTTKAIEADWDLKFIPVVLLNATAEETALIDLLFPLSVAVTATESVSKDDVLAAFKALRAKKLVSQPEATPTAEQPKRRGRPPGSKNKPKDQTCPVYEGEGETCGACGKLPSDHVTNPNTNQQ